MMDNQFAALKALQRATQHNKAWKDSTYRALKEIEKVKNIVKPYNGAERALAEIQRNLKIERLGIIESCNMNSLKLSKAVGVNTQLLSSAAAAFQTSEISELVNGLANNNMIESVKKFSQCLHSPQVEAANLGLIKMNATLADAIKDWNGMASFVKGINMPTAKFLVASEDIVVDTEKKVFVSKEDEDCIAKNDEMNVIASSISLFKDITATELMKLNDILATGIEFAMTNLTAQHIFEIIQNWNNYISFDKEEYYRARKIEEGQAPYTIKNFGVAPEKCVGYGRFNHDGQCHYYVASSEKGACAEIKKHCRKASLQVATLKPKREVKLIDLSDKTDGIIFLNHLRFEVDVNERVPRAYLLPCFVTSCCKRTQIEGIKYYGSKEYDNYVTWESGYYEVVDVSEPR